MTSKDIRTLCSEEHNKWDPMDPEIMILKSKDNFEIVVDLIKCNENKLIKFCLTKGKEWNETEFLVPAAAEPDKAYAFLKEENRLQRTSENLMEKAPQRLVLWLGSRQERKIPPYGQSPQKHSNCRKTQPS